MASTVCQGLQSCLEPRLVEPRVLIHNLAPQKSNLWAQKPNVSQPQEHQTNEIVHSDNNSKNSYYYSFLDSKHQNNKKRDGESFWGSITSQNCKEQPPEEEEEEAAGVAELYVHPLVKRSSSTLSTKSLEMCTESLGSETGSSIGKSIDDFPSPLQERSNLDGIQRNRQREFPKKINRSASFPPPLTSISGSEGVRMRPHREGGRLVVKAVSVASCSPYFQTERSNGRLRLSLLKGGTSPEDDESERDPRHPAEQIGQQQQQQQFVCCQDASDDDDDDERTSSSSSSSSEDEELEEVTDENVGYDVGVGEFPRPSRCKEGGGGRNNKRIPSWEPFLVAI